MSTECQVCGAAIRRASTGRPRKFCSNRCKQRAKRGDRGLFASQDTNTAPTAADPAAAIASWAGRCLQVPTGRLAGRPFTVTGWQLAWLRGALAPGVLEAGLSIARKNGKSGLVAVACLAFLAGPLNRPNWRGIVASLTGGLATELRDAIRQTAAAAGIELAVYRSPTPGRIEGRQGSRLDFLAADKATGHAVGADLAIIDEGGLLAEKDRELWAAMRSSVSGRDGRLWVISVRGDGPMFRELKERAADPAVHWTEYAAEAAAPIDDPATWAAANPGLADGIKSTDYMRSMARGALANPADQPRFRSLDLNMPEAPDRQMICAPDDWLACQVEPHELPPRDGRCVVGFDLGGSLSMSAAVALWPATRRLEAWAALPDTPDLVERGRADGVGGLYAQMRDAGELWTYAGRVIPAAAFLGDVLQRLYGQHVLAIGTDRYRRAETEQALADAGAAVAVEWRGTGASKTADGSHDVRAFQRAVMANRLRAAPSLLMMHAIAESELRFDAAGNPALDKGRKRGRIDVLQAAVIACGLADDPRAQAPAAEAFRYHVARRGAHVASA